MVNLVDDNLYEEDEEFRLVLGTPKSKSPFGASIGEQKEVVVTITDEKDSKHYPRNTEISTTPNIGLHCIDLSNKVLQ